MMAPMLLMILAAAGSAMAAARRRQAPVLRAAHAVMAVVMLSMAVSGNRSLMLAGLAAVALTGAMALRHHLMHASGLPCAVDLACMGALLGVLSLTHARLAVTVLLALGCAVSSAWAHGEVALRTGPTAALAIETASAATGVLGMALMAVAMA